MCFWPIALGITLNLNVCEFLSLLLPYKQNNTHKTRRIHQIQERKQST